MVIDLKVNEIANLGSNVKTMIKNENCSVLMMSDATGEGIMIAVSSFASHFGA